MKYPVAVWRRQLGVVEDHRCDRDSERIILGPGKEKCIAQEMVKLDVVG
jgi:hypothetical protein